MPKKQSHAGFNPDIYLYRNEEVGQLLGYGINLVIDVKKEIAAVYRSGCDPTKPNGYMEVRSGDLLEQRALSAVPFECPRIGIEQVRIIRQYLLTHPEFHQRDRKEKPAPPAPSQNHRAAA